LDEKFKNIIENLKAELGQTEAEAIPNNQKGQRVNFTENKNKLASKISQRLRNRRPEHWKRNAKLRKRKRMSNFALG
jgi:hypothetical protein